MRTMKRYSLITLMTIAIFNIGQAQTPRKKIDFVGGARSVVQSANLNTIDSFPDTTSLQSTLGGYALVDLGVAIRPNNETEIMGMFRIRNDFGGFWGSDVTFDVRQLWLKGVLGGVLKYQVGDLNLKQTPFTLYNHHADRIDSLPEILKMQNDIISYENFYSPDNTWRQQGVAVDFGLNFSKGVKALDFMAYVTRLRASDFQNTPERLMPGGSVDLWILDDLSVGYNLNATVDLPSTAKDSSSTYRNTVQTVDVKYRHSFGKNVMKLSGEYGASITRYKEATEENSLKDNFWHLQGEIEIPSIQSEIGLGYLYVAPEFRSVAAQSKDINYQTTSGYFDVYTNTRQIRPLGLYDVVAGAELYNRTVSSSLMPINPVFNNVLPYGLATFNRTGFYFKYTFKNDYLRVDLQNYRLAEILGQGINQLRQFNSAQLLTKLDIHELVSLKRNLDISFGVKSDRTWRDGVSGLGAVDLESFQFHTGLNWEFFENIDFMIGYLMQNTTGNEFLTERNVITEPVVFTDYNFDVAQSLFSVGLRYRFSPNIYLSAFYQQSEYLQGPTERPSYDTDNFNILFNMTF